MPICTMIHHFHGGTSLITIPEGPTLRQALDIIWATLNDPDSPSPNDIIVNSGQPGDLISFIGRSPFAQRHAVVESEGFTTFMTTEFAVKHIADRTVLREGVRLYDPSEALHPSPSDLIPEAEVDDAGPDDPVACACCGHRTASVHEPSSSFCATCYEAGAARDDRDQT